MSNTSWLARILDFVLLIPTSRMRPKSAMFQHSHKTTSDHQLQLHVLSKTPMDGPSTQTSTDVLLFLARATIPFVGENVKIHHGAEDSHLHRHDSWTTRYFSTNAILRIGTFILLMPRGGSGSSKRHASCSNMKFVSTITT